MLEPCRQQRLLEQRRDEPRRILGRKGRQGKRRRVQLASAPCRTPLEQLRACRADDEERHSAGPVDEVVDEVEKSVVGPVEILEDEDEWTLLRERLEEEPPRARTPQCRPQPDASGQPDERPQVRARPTSSILQRNGGRHRCLELLARAGRRVGVEDAGLRLHHLPERPVRDALAVREAATLPPGEQIGIVVDDTRTAPRSSRLFPIPGTPISVTSCGARSARTRASACVTTSTLVRAADERVRASLLDVDAEARARADDLPDAKRVGLSLGGDRLAARAVRTRLSSRGTSTRPRGCRLRGRRPAAARPCSRHRPRPCPRPHRAARRASRAPRPS